MSETVKRYNLRQNMPATAKTFLPDVVVSASDYARLEQECERWKETAAGLDRQNDAIAAELAASSAQAKELGSRLTEMTEDRDDCLAARSHYVGKLGDALAQIYKLERLLARCQEKLDPHRDAVLWGEVCDAFKVKP